MLTTELMLTNDEKLLARLQSGDIAVGCRIWEPPDVSVVLGRSNQAANEVEIARCQQAQIPILRRRGGGGTVLLAPGVLVITLVKRVKRRYHFQEYFQQVNAVLIAALMQLGVCGLTQRGISDICLDDRKILGSSMYRPQDILFYTASLMVANDVRLLDVYLKHPSKEPAYRQGRSHQHFVTTLASAYPALSVATLNTHLAAFLPEQFEAIE